MSSLDRGSLLALYVFLSTPFPLPSFNPQLLPRSRPENALLTTFPPSPQASQATDPTHFPSPSAVDPSRPLDKYLYPGLGPHSCLGRDVFLIALTEMFRAVFRKTNLRRTPGPQGELKKIAPRQDGEGGGGGSSSFSGSYLTEDWSSVSPLPTSMRVCWDE